MKISVFIITLNEARKIRACLQSVQWADEIVVLDMHSEDETVAIAREFTGKIFSVDRISYCEPARKIAAEKTQGEWILNVDADEIVTLGLKRALLRIVREGLYDAVYVPRKNYFWGEEMRFSGCGQFQDRPLRFYKKGAVSFSDTIHAGIRLNGPARVCKIDDPQAYLLHFSYASPQQYWEKMDRYTTIEAEALFHSGNAYTLKKALKDAWDAFWKRYIKKGKGYKDKQWGLMYCLWTAVYRLNIYAKYVLMKTYGAADYVPQIEKKYDVLINSALKELKEDGEKP
jgi:glycosyltransferase involved in cell wall biosynthesis